jgi:hypothetical protein
VVVVAGRCNVCRVTGNATPTEADKQLISELADHGLPATAKQFKRWRAAGLLDPPARPGAGRGKGRPSLSYPSAAGEQAAAIIRLLGCRVPLDEMAMAMFLDHVPVSESAVRKALHSMLADPKSENLDEEAREHLAEQRIIDIQGRSRRIPLLREWSQMARAAGNRGSLTDMVAAIMYTQSEGTFPSDEAVEETARVFDASTHDVTLFYAYLKDFGIPVLRTAIDTVSLQELRTAQSFIKAELAEIFPSEARNNYRFFGIAVLYFAILLPTGDIETDSAVLKDIASLIAES